MFSNHTITSRFCNRGKTKSDIRTLQQYPSGTVRSILLYRHTHDKQAADLDADLVLSDQD